MTEPHTLLASHLAPGETILWQETVTDARFEAADARQPIKSTLLALAALILGLWFTIWGVMKAGELLEKPDYLSLSFGAPIVIVLALAMFWYAFMNVRLMLGPAPRQKLPAVYAVTDTRLLAVLSNGTLADELANGDIAGFADTDSDTELLINRRGDESGEDGFYILLVNDLDGAREAIEGILRNQ